MFLGDRLGHRAAPPSFVSSGDARDQMHESIDLKTGGILDRLSRGHCMRDVPADERGAS